MAASKTSSNLVHRTNGLASDSNPSPIENGPGRQGGYESTHLSILKIKNITKLLLWWSALKYIGWSVSRKVCMFADAKHTELNSEVMLQRTRHVEVREVCLSLEIIKTWAIIELYRSCCPLSALKVINVLGTQADISLFPKQRIKAEVIEQVKAQMSEVLDKVLTDSLQSFSQSADSSAVENTHQKTAEKARR